MVQKDRWEREYEEHKHLPSSRKMTPARAVVDFVTSHVLATGTKALDIGCGQGRNSIYLAQQGIEVVGIDISEAALRVGRRAIQEAGVESHVTLILGNAGERIPYEDESFDLVVDMMMLHLLDHDEARNYSSEVVRLLRQGGYHVFKTLAADSPDAEKLFLEYPGPAPNSYIIPESGMIEQCFTDYDLRELFAPLVVESLKKFTEPVDAFGKVYERTYYVGVMKK